MCNMKKLLLSLTLLLACTMNGFSQQVAPFKAGDRVTFVGNSITDGGRYHSYIWLYYMTHFPQMRLWMANCGIGGDTGKNILQRLDGDVFSKNPTVITLTFGMNDSGYFEYNSKDSVAFGNKMVAESRKNFLEIEKKLKAKEKEGVRMIMIGTSPYDQTSTFNDNVFKNKNNYIQKIIAFQDSAAKADNWEFVDFNQPMLDINAREQAKDPKYTLIGNDRVHPDNDGHMVMAYIFLKAQGMVGKNIADININGKNKKVVKSDNCTISNVVKDNGKLSFDYLAKSLPYPLDTIAHGWGFKRPQSQVVKAIPSFMKDLDNENLTVTGLKGNYVLTIDGQKIDTLSAEQLKEGVNLANYRQTPQYQQACAIMALNEDRLDIEHRFRDYAWLQYDFFLGKGMLDANDEEAAEIFRQGQQKDGWVAARREIYDKMIHKEVRDTYEDEMNLIVNKIYSINKPVTRKIVLTAVE